MISLTNKIYEKSRHRRLFDLAEAKRFELLRGLHPLSVFKTDPFNRLGKLPWWTLQDSNLQPAGYEPEALTIELRVRRSYILI